MRVLAQTASARGQLDQARKHLNRSVLILGQAQDEYEWARSVLALARVDWMQGRADECVAALDRCQPVFERLGASLEVIEGRALRGEIDRAIQEA